MIKSVNRWRVDKKKSFMIGDRLKDYQAAKSKLYEYAKPNFKDQIDKIIKKLMIKVYEKLIVRSKIKNFRILREQ